METPLRERCRDKAVGSKKQAVEWKALTAPQPIAHCRLPESGFTLIEVLVALTILSISIAVLFGIFAEGLARTHEAEQEMAARALAQSLLAQTNAFGDVPFGIRSGHAPQGLSWELRLAPYPQRDDTTAAVHAAIVSATVGWHETSGDRSLRLSTLQIHPKDMKP